MTSDTSKGAYRLRNWAIFFLLLMPIAALGSRFGLWSFMLGLPLLLVAVVGSLLIEIIIAIWFLRKPNTGTKSVLRNTGLIALIPVLIFAFIISTSQRSEIPIHNISTDTTNPPGFVEAIALRGENSNPTDYSSENAAAQVKIHPEVAPILTSLTVDQAFQKALETAKKIGWKIHTQKADEGRIEATETSLWFGFTDDIAIRVTADELGSRVDLHSVSRVGMSDLGVNAKRIVEFSTLFTTD